MHKLATVVTPFVGVWIETRNFATTEVVADVTPFVGVWIETVFEKASDDDAQVTPFVGVWIETPTGASLTSCRQGHTLRGCVD